jgi:hypothetical protein
MWKILKREEKLFQLSKDLKDAQAELEKLRSQNENMRQGMRRCVTCDYRIQAKQADRTTANKQTVEISTPPSNQGVIDEHQGYSNE